MNEPTNDARRASDVLYDEIIASRNSVRRENILVIKKVCDQMEKDGVQMAAAEIVRRCGPNGPAYSTVCNTGSKLGEYIRLRINEQTSRAKGTAKNSSLADTVLDPVLQAQIRDKETLARWLQKENDALRTLLKTMRPGFDIDTAIANASRSGRALLPSPPALEDRTSTDGLQSVLLKLMDHLVGGRQYCFIKGRLTVNKKVVLDSSEVVAYRDAAKMNPEDWSRRYELLDGSDIQH